ncbi:MAG: phosphoenolpyruvate carboxylase, partial [Dehalococcoidia bacterium]|nr:phosphoenolpyruvate carboxylase [Dehalococcoidia bacterium]
MPLIPKVMSTQHPDNASPAPFADDTGVLRGDGEVEEAVDVFALGCDEQMWDSEGKEADNQVVRKLLTGYPDFFQDDIRLGADVALTLRVPNPRVERDMRKSMVEALQSVSSSWDMAEGFYGDGHVAPIQEVILPLTTSAEELSMVEAYYRKVIVGQEDQAVLGGQPVKDWVGEFYPKSIRVIPLIEDMEHLFYCDHIVEEYLQDRDLPYQRVFLARSDPALNYGMVAAELILKVGLLRLHNLEVRLGLPLYPIIGAGSAPFRGHLGPTNVERSLAEYPSAQTFTVQSAFKYDYDRDTVRDGIARILAHERTEPVFIDQDRAKEIIDKSTEEYQARVRDLTGVITSVSAHVPRRRERKMHVGLFGYGRSLDGVGGVTLPRAIGFAASLYSIGVPPELLGLACLDESDLEFIRDVYPNMDEDLSVALSFTNERNVRELLGDAYMSVVGQYTDELDRVH